MMLFYVGLLSFEKEVFCYAGDRKPCFLPRKGSEIGDWTPSTVEFNIMGAAEITGLTFARAALANPYAASYEMQSTIRVTATNTISFEVNLRYVESLSDGVLTIEKKE